MAQSSSPRSAQHDRATAYDEFCGRESGPGFPVPFRLQRAMLAAGLSPAANVTLQVLYQYAAVSIANGYVNAVGEVKIWPSHETLSGHLAVSPRSLGAYLSELERLGAIRREPLRVRGRPTELFVRAMPHFLALLLEREGVGEALIDRFPDQREGVVSLSEFFQQRRAFTEPTTQEIEVSIEDAKLRTGRGLAALAQANAKSAGAQQRQAERQAAKPPKPEKATPVARSTDTPHDLLEMLRRCVYTDLKSFTRPKSTLENLSKLSRLAKEFGYENTRRLIEFTTQPDNWAQLTSRFRLETPFPTPGMLLGFSEQWMPMALGTVPIVPVPVEKRSGGAAAVDLSEYGITKTRGQF